LVVCAWCKPQQLFFPFANVSHGICPDCLKLWKQKKAPVAAKGNSNGRGTGAERNNAPNS